MCTVLCLSCVCQLFNKEFHDDDDDDEMNCGNTTDRIGSVKEDLHQRGSVVQQVFKDKDFTYK